MNTIDKLIRNYRKKRTVARKKNFDKPKEVEQRVKIRILINLKHNPYLT
jgi:hypothetical protein